MKIFLSLVGAFLVSASTAPRLAEAQVAVIGNTTEEFVAQPGEMISHTIVIANNTSEPQTVRLYQTDYAFSADGTSRFDDPGTMPRSNAAWITPLTHVLVVAAGSEAKVAYAVRVPNDSSLKGSYWSAIMVEGAPTASVSRPVSRNSISLGVVTRYAVQVATHIGSTGSRKIDLVSPSVVVDSSGATSMQCDVANTGERAYRPIVWVEIYDTTGALRKRVKQERGLIYPGSSVRQTFALGRLPSGTYRAVLYADIGDPAVFAKQFNIQL